MPLLISMLPVNVLPPESVSVPPPVLVTLAVVEIWSGWLFTEPLIVRLALVATSMPRLWAPPAPDWFMNTGTLIDDALPPAVIVPV